jgi:hypothetical protein
MVQRVITFAVDAIIFDPEDAVPIAAKAATRDAIKEALQDYPQERSCKTYVRVNSLDTGLTADDVRGVSCSALDGIILPKVGLVVLATTPSLVVVFIPVSFMSSVSGRFLYQFGLTAGVSVMVGRLVSFTLTPVMSARLLRAEDVAAGSGHDGAGSRRGFYAWIDRSYRWSLGLAMRHRSAARGTPTYLRRPGLWSCGSAAGVPARGR